MIFGQLLGILRLVALTSLNPLTLKASGIELMSMLGLIPSPSSQPLHASLELQERLAFQEMLQSRPCPRVEDITLLQPAPPRLIDPVADLLKLRRGMCIGRNGKLDATLLGEPAMDIIEIKPAWRSVDLQKTSALLGSIDDPLNVDLIGWALVDQPAGRMGKDVEIGIVHRAYDAFCLLIARQVELVVDGGDSDIELAHHPVG